MGRILLVEPRAGERRGHHMTRVEALARAMHALGHEVHLLTGEPLAIEAEGRTLDGVAHVHVASQRWLRFDRWSERRMRGSRHRAPRALAAMTRQVALVRCIRSCSRALGDPPTLVLSATLSIGPAALLAPRRARWTLYEVMYRRGGVQSPSTATRLASRGIAWRERRRRRAGGWVRLVANSEFGRQTWTARYRWIESAVIATAAISEVVPESRATARVALGLDPTARIGLVFGHAHTRKDLATVFLAFSGPDAPGTLVAAGGRMQHALDEVTQQHPSTTFPKVTVIDGPRSDREKHLLHSAADYAIISTKPGFASDSGTLSDAVAYGLPVCCSDSCEPGTVVAEHGLGLTFTNGDPGSLRDAAERIGGYRVDSEGRDALVRARSPEAVARRMLAFVLGLEMDQDPAT